MAALPVDAVRCGHRTRPCSSPPTCPAPRENSARKEAAPLLARYLEQCRGVAHGSGPEPDAAAAAAVEPGPEDGEAGAAGGGTKAPQQQEQPTLGTIKISCRGMVALKLSAHPAPAGSSDGTGGTSLDAAASRLVHEAVAALLADIAGGKQARLGHVQRVTPVQTTCRLEAGALHAAGQQLAGVVAAAVAGSSTAAAAAVPDAPRLTFGIGLKQREASAPGKVAAAEGGAAADAAAPAAPPDRGTIIRQLASGFEGALRERHGIAAAVDLKAPDWVLVAEVLPAGGGVYVALCALPRALCLLKPKICIAPVGKAGV